MTSIKFPIVANARTLCGILNEQYVSFKVDQIFILTNLGFVLLPGLGIKKANIGSKIKIIRLDNSAIETVIREISFNDWRDIF